MAADARIRREEIKNTAAQNKCRNIQEDEPINEKCNGSYTCEDGACEWHNDD